MAVASLLVPVMLVFSACRAGVESGSPTSTLATTSTAPAAPGPGRAGSASGQVVPIVVRRGKVQGPSIQRVDRNETVTIRATIDVADTIHVYGYDKTAPAVAGATTELSFVANVSGVFKVGLDRTNQLLFELEVGS